MSLSPLMANAIGRMDATDQGDGQRVAQASRLRVLAASRRQKRKNNRARRPVNSQARTPALLCQRPCGESQTPSPTGSLAAIQQLDDRTSRSPQPRWLNRAIETFD